MEDEEGVQADQENIRSEEELEQHGKSTRNLTDDMKKKKGVTQRKEKEQSCQECEEAGGSAEGGVHWKFLGRQCARTRTHTHMSACGEGLVCMIRFQYDNTRLGSSGIRCVHIQQ